jgi:pilus assembly protein FimV
MRSTCLFLKDLSQVIQALRGVLMVANRLNRGWALKWAVLACSMFPASAFALGLGDIRLLSSLNSPLDAEIELVGATPEELAGLKAQIASRETFARYGLEWPVFLGSVSLRSTRSADGREIIKLTSTDTVTEPFLTLLVEVNWARGRLVREYTMLLDPPVYTPGPSQVASNPVTAPSIEAAREGAINRLVTPPAPQPEAVAPAPAPAPAPAAATPAPSMSPPPVSEGGDSRTVRSGETLSGISTEYSGGDPLQNRSWMLAIYQNNPGAFDGNMNILRSGAVLRIPEGSRVAEIVPSEASAEIRRQYAAWRGAAAQSTAAADSEPGRLRLVTPTETGGAGTGGDSEALQGRVRELEAQLAESNRLLEVQNAELARLQARIASQGPQPETPAEAPPAQPPVAETPVETAPSDETPIEEPAAETPVAAADTPPDAEAATPPPAEEPVERPLPTAAEESAEPSLVDTLLGYWWVLAAIVALLAVLYGVKAYRSRQQNEFDDSLGRLAAVGAETLSRSPSGDTQPLRATGREAAFVVEESGPHERPRFGAEPVPAAAPRNVPSDETISSETAINLDQGDPLAEADFHMAYGLYDQAADLVRIAISREPGRRDLKLKLLEVFFVWGNKDQFLQAARELADSRDNAAPGEWEKIVIMGKQLAPEDPLFAGGGALSGASAGGVDLDLEGGQSRVDFDILGEPVPSNGAGASLDLDIGSALGDADATQQSRTGNTQDHNLALHDQELDMDVGSATTRQMTQKMSRDSTAVMSGYGDTQEQPTIEQPGMYQDNPTIRQKVEMAIRQGGSVEQTAELAIDDLGLDLTALDTIDQPGLGASDAPTLVAGLDEKSRRMMDEAQRRGAPAQDEGMTSTGSWHLSSDDLDPTMPPNQVRAMDNGVDPASTASLKNLKGSDLDFDFDDVDGPSPSTTNGSGVDLDVGAPTAPDTAFTATQKLSSEDLALPDLEPVTMSEVGTKLDLARAYMDMGDPEGARNILEEVLQEGSVAQKQEAQRLLESLPG